jgi:hypothetical protein
MAFMANSRDLERDLEQAAMLRPSIAAKNPQNRTSLSLQERK